MIQMAIVRTCRGCSLGDCENRASFDPTRRNRLGCYMPPVLGGKKRRKVIEHAGVTGV